MKRLVTKEHYFGIKRKKVHHAVRSTYWFVIGFILAAALFGGGIIFYFQHVYRDKVIPGVFVDNVYIGDKSEIELQEIFDKKNEAIQKNTIIFWSKNMEATVSAKELKLGYDVDLIKAQSMSLGKSKNFLSDAYIILSSYINGTFLHSVYTFNDNALKEKLKPIQDLIFKEPVDALFKINGNRVVAFKQSSNGEDIDYKKLNIELNSTLELLTKSSSAGISRISIPIKISEPKVTTQEANDLGIVEEIGQGNSTFLHSIPSRIFNISLASSKINGVLVAPGETFSFAKAVGDISKYTGYQEAYIISGGKTILGDGGGVCQVSTTLFRAILNSGLPIAERHAHSYRVGYYEQDSPPGIDATVYVPTVDLKFKNDTENHILIQSYFNPTNLTLKFVFYGKKDGREVSISKPIITNVSNPPAPIYQDDPSLPLGTVKQIEYQASGARASFSRTVTKNGQVMINDTYVSNYTPWQAVFLRGTGGQ